MKTPIHFILFLVMLVSCKKNENSDAYKNNPTPIKKTTQTELQYVENDTLVSALEKSINELFKNPKFILEKELIENKHVDNTTDTIITYKWNKTYIKTYKTVSEEWAFESVIQNSEFTVFKSIKTGIDKKSLETIINEKINSDLIRVSNLEQTSVVEFIFANNLLKEINFEGYVD